MSANTQSEVIDETHQVDLERSQMRQAVKRPYQAVPTMSRNSLRWSETSVQIGRAHV